MQKQIDENKRLEFFVNIFSKLSLEQLIDEKNYYEEEGVKTQLQAINILIKEKIQKLKVYTSNV